MDTDAEKEMKSEEQKGLRVFSAEAAASRCKWRMIADLERLEGIAEFLFNVYCMFEQT